MSDHTAIDMQVRKLRALASALIPGRHDRPAPTDIADLDTLIARAIAASGAPAETIAAACDAVPDGVDWDGAKALSESEPEAFRLASQLASSAYYMARETLDALGFPPTRENPAEVSDFVDEMETGVFEPMIESEPRFRDDRI